MDGSVRTADARWEGCRSAFNETYASYRYAAQVRLDALRRTTCWRRWTRWSPRSGCQPAPRTPSPTSSAPPATTSTSPSGSCPSGSHGDPSAHGAGPVRRRTRRRAGRLAGPPGGPAGPAGLISLVTSVTPAPAWLPGDRASFLSLEVPRPAVLPVSCFPARRRTRTDGEQFRRPGHGRGPGHRQHARLRARPGHPGRRAERGRGQREDRRAGRRRARRQADGRAHPGGHHRDPAAPGRRDRRLRGHRADAAPLHRAGAPPPLPGQAADGRLRAERDHRRRAAGGQGGRLPGRRAPGLHHRGADGRRDRRRAARAPGHRQHGRRRRGRYDGGRRDQPRRHRHQPERPDRGRRGRPGHHELDEEGARAPARRGDGRGGQDDPRLGVPRARRPRGGDPRPRPGLRACRAP